MDPTTKPRRRPPVASAKSRRKTILWVAGGALVTVAGLTLYYQLALTDRVTHHELPVSIPMSEPHGEPVHVGGSLKGGDAFVTKVTSETYILLDTSEQIQMKEGMNVHVELALNHSVAAAAHGDGTVSTIKVYLDRADATYGAMGSAIWAAIGQRNYPYTLTFDRDAAGRRSRASVVESTPMPAQRFTLDGIFSGLSDLSSNGLPDRDVRLGEAWDLSESMPVSGIEDVVRYVAQRNTNREGFPKAAMKGVVKAEAQETRGGVSCLRLHLVVSVAMEGDVTPGTAKEPNLVGYLSTAARIDGSLWVSLDTGLLWEEDLQSEIKSSYLVATRPTNRHATCHLTAKTSRAPP